jgi:hypothetical protein
MGTKDKIIKNPCKLFLDEVYEKSKDIFFSENVENTVCRVKFNSDFLFLLPTTEDLNNIRNYGNLKYLEINNFKIGKKENSILENNLNILKNITHLKIWNIMQNDLEILKYFPKLTHLLISYIRKDNFSFTGLNYANKLNTLCLSSANKICDFNFMEKMNKIKIKNMSITYCSRLNNFNGIDGYTNLETLIINYSTSESRKRKLLESISGIEYLNKLKYLELSYYKIDMGDLQNKIISIKTLKEYIVDNKKYKNKI